MTILEKSNKKLLLFFFLSLRYGYIIFITTTTMDENIQSVGAFLREYYYEKGIDEDQLVDRLGNPNLFDQEDLAEFILEITSKGIIKDYL